MLKALIIAALTCAALLIVIFVKPTVTVRGSTVSIYWVIPLIGAAAMVVSGAVTPADVVRGVAASGEINPVKILLLFLSMTLMSVFLDEAGFFVYLAGAVLRRAKTSQKALFFYLYLTVSVLTVFTSNDIIVLTFTPFICYFAKRAHIAPFPYLMGEFVAANTWSMALIIGNPTNIYLGTAYGVSFLDYTRVMLLPTLFAGIASAAALYLLFRRQLQKPLVPDETVEPIRDKASAAIGLVHLGICIVLLALSSYVGLPMWLISFLFAVSLFAVASVHLLRIRRGLDIVRHSLSRAPWETVPFVLSMFVIVLALDKNGFTALAADFLSHGPAPLTYGVSSCLCANVINNIPMSVLYSSILNAGQGGRAALFAAVIGSNIGAFLTPAGALAGIMWTGMLRHHGVHMTFRRFTAYGAMAAVPALAGALIGLILIVA